MTQINTNNSCNMHCGPIPISDNAFRDMVVQYILCSSDGAPLSQKEVENAIRYVNDIIAGNLYDSVLLEMLKSFESETGLSTKFVDIKVISANGNAFIGW